MATTHIQERIDYKNVDLLRQFLTEEGKMLPRRITGLSAKQQREVSRAIKQARVMALLEFIHKET
jgi:small subunit ribosomal protein S18